MNIGVVGLGLIGGSLAKAYKKKGFTVLAWNRNKVITDFAKMSGDIDGELTAENLGECDCVFLSITTGGAIDWLVENAGKIPAGVIVMDCCGIKRKVCETGFRLARENGFTFVGGHPMAGKQVGGFKNSSGDIFEGSVFAIVPEDMNDIGLLTRIKEILKPAGFTRFAVMTAEEHDEIIAYTSQMTHLVSNAFIKSRTAMSRNAKVTGGSFRDFTRVAYLDENMWTELFLENRDNLIYELETLMGELERYLKALKEGDKGELKDLLAEGKKRKEEVECNASS